MKITKNSKSNKSNRDMIIDYYNAQIDIYKRKIEGDKKGIQWYKDTKYERARILSVYVNSKIKRFRKFRENIRHYKSRINEAEELSTLPGVTILGRTPYSISVRYEGKKPNPSERIENRIGELYKIDVSHKCDGLLSIEVTRLEPANNSISSNTRPYDYKYILTNKDYILADNTLLDTHDISPYLLRWATDWVCTKGYQGIEELLDSRKLAQEERLYDNDYYDYQ